MAGDSELMELPGLKAAFEHAGIKDDPVDLNDAVTEGQKDASQADQAKSADSGIDIKTGDEPKQEGDNKQQASKDVGTGGKRDGKDQPVDKTKEGQGADPADDNAVIASIRKGDPVNPAAAERWYRQRDTARAERDDWKRQHTELSTQLQQAQSNLATFQEAARATGLENPVDIQHATKLYKDFVSNPVGTLTTLVAELKAKGYTVDAVGAQANDQAVRLLLERQTQAQPSQQQQNQQPDPGVQVQTFFSQYPDAKVHEDMLADVITKFPQYTLNQAYWELRNSAASRGLDWSRDLRPQLNPGGQQQQQQQQRDPNPPRPNGRVDAGNVVDHSKANVAPAGDTWDDIIRSAL